MVEKNAIGVGGFVLLFLGVIVALAILPTIAKQQSELTTKIPVVNETIDISDAIISGWGAVNESFQFNITNYNTIGWKQSKCPISGVVVRNSTGNTATLGTDYIFTPTLGNFSFMNTTTFNQSNLANLPDANNTYVDYSYCADGYVTNSGGRAIAALIVLFSALGIVAYVLFYAVRRFNQ